LASRFLQTHLSQPHHIRIGITGGIGSGKSTVAQLWVKCGAHLIDLDAISHTLTQPKGAALPLIFKVFGPSVFDAQGHLDRPRLREHVFANPNAKTQLEAILHPLIWQQAQTQAAQVPIDKPLVFEVPLLVESKQWQQHLQHIVVVDCSENTQINRVLKRSKWSQDAVLAVIKTQAKRCERLAIAAAVISNENDSPDALYTQVQALWQKWCINVKQ
jgi:dephospho-CoA kinase